MIDSPTLTIRKATNPGELRHAFQIRETVFVKEQGVPPEEEYDEHDQSATHLIVYDAEGVPCGTARWRQTDKGIKLERFAVLRSHRGQGVGRLLLDTILWDIEEDPNVSQQQVYIHAQTPAVEFYKKFGFDQVGEEFEECNIKHYEMIL